MRKISIGNFLTTLFICFLIFTSRSEAQRVLILNDQSTVSSSTTGLKDYLQQNGCTVTISTIPENQFNGTQYTLSNFDCVLHFDGASYGSPMTTQGQQAIVNFVSNGGGYIGGEWLAYEIANHSIMNDLILTKRTSGSEGVLTLTKVTGVSHPILNGLPPSFSTTGNWGKNIGGLNNTINNYQTVLTNIMNDQSGYPAVVVREYNSGKVCFFNHSTGNYTTGQYTGDANLLKLYLNAVQWVSGGINISGNSCLPTHSLSFSTAYNNSNDPAVGYSWSTSDGQSATTATWNNVQFASAGTYSVTVVLTLQSAQTRTYTRDFTIYALPTTADAGPDQQICSGTSVTMAGNTVGSGAWTRVSGPNTPTITSSSSPTTTITGLTTGTYVFKWTSSNGTCPASDDQVTIAVGVTNAGTLSGTQSICTGSQTSQFTSTVSGGTWTTSDANVATVGSSSGIVTSAGPGTATITYTVTGTGGCANGTATRTVTVTTAPNSGTLSGVQSINPSATSQITSNGTSGGTWTSSDATIASVNASGLVTGVAAGSATITYTVSGTGGCANASSTILINVVACNAGTLSGTQAVCSNGTSQFTSNGVSGGSWSTSSNSVATVSNAGLVTGVAAGTATITYTVTGTGCSNSATRTVTVTAAPNAGTLSGTQAICIAGTSQFSSNGASGGSWTSGTTGVATISSSGLVTGVAAGTSTITYTVVGTGGCANATATRTVTVSAAPDAGTLTGAQSICYNGTTQFSSSVINKALAFDGTNDYLKTATNISALNILGDITVEGWFKINQMPSDWVMLIGKGDGGSNRTYGLWLNPSGTLLWQMYGGGNVDLSTTTALQTNTWYHLAANRIGNTVKIYINGVEAASGTKSGAPNSSTSPLQIGYGNIHTYLNGSVDEVRVWNVGRTASEINNSMNIELSAQAGLVAYYKLNQGVPGATNTGITSATDASGNGFDASLTNFALSGATSNWSSRDASNGTWASSNTAVATVSATGLVTGTGAGTATITYTVPGTGGCANATATRTVTVNDVLVNQVASQYINNGGTTAPVTFTSPTAGVTFNWTNSNTAIIPVTQAGGNIAAFSVSNNGTGPVSTTISVTATGLTNGLNCTGSPMTFQIVVNPVAIMNQPSSQEVCPGATTSAVNFTSGNTGGTVTYAWTNDNSNIGLAASGTGNIVAFTATNTSSNTQVATITVTPTYTNGGTANTGSARTFTITVKPNPSVTQLANQEYCNGSTASVSFGSPVSGTTYTWTNSNTSIGLAASGTGNISSFQASNAGVAPISGTIAVTPTSNGCVGAPMSFVITVNPTPTITTSTTSQVVCAGATVPAATFAGAVSGTNIRWSNSNTAIGLAASGTGNIPAFTATNTGTSPAVGTITVTPTLGAGTSGRLSYTMYSTHNGNGTATQYGPYPNNAAEFDELFNTANTHTTVTGTGEAAAGVVLNFYNTGTLTSNGIAVPNNGEFYGIKLEGTFVPAETGSYVFGVDGDDAVEVSIGGTVVAAWYGGHGFGGYQVGNPINLVAGQSYTFRARMQEFGGGDGMSVAWRRPSQSSLTLQADEIFGSSCLGTPYTYTITVNPIPTIASQSNQLVCAGSTVTANLAGAVSGTTYNWTNTNTAIGLAASGTGNISFAATNPGPDPISGVITASAAFTNGGVTCQGGTVSFTTTVNPVGQVNAINNQVLCNGSTTVAATLSTTNNSTSIVGTENASSGTISVSVPDASAVGATSTIPVTLPAGAIITNMRVTLNMTHTWISDMVINLRAPNGQVLNLFNAHGGSGDNLVNTVISSTGTASLASGTAPFTGTYAATAAVGVGPTGNASTAANFAALYGTPNGNWVLALRDLFGGDLGTLTGWNLSIDYTIPVNFTTFNWTNSVASIGLAASGTGNVPSFTAVNTGSAPVVSTVTVTPVFNSGGLGCAGTPVTYTYTVNPTATVNAVTNQTFCAGTASTVNFSGATTGTVYNWTSSNAAIGLAASGTGNLSFTPTNTTNAPIVSTITVTPSYTNAGVTCTGTPRTFTITVNPVGQVNTVNDQVLCNGAGTTAVNFATVNGGGTVQVGTPVTVNSGAITVAIPDFNPAGATHSVPVTLPAGATITGVSVNFNMTHTWLADMVVNLRAPNGQILNLVNRRGGSGDNFVNTTISSASTTSLATGAAPFTGTFAADAALNVGPTTFVSTATNFAALYSVANGDWTLGMRDYAGGDLGTLTGWSITFNYTTVAGAVTTYNWTNTTPSIGLAASGVGNIASFAAANTSTVPVTATVSVTPTYTNAGVSCAGPASSFTYTVNPTPTVSAVSNQAVCVGSSVAAVTFGGTVSGTVYTWTNSNTAIGLAASGTGNIPSFVGTNTTSAPISGTITVTPVFTNAGVTCNGTPRTFTITVNPIPTVNPVASFPVCHNSTAAVTFSGATTGTVYSWTNSTPSIGLAASGTGNISFTALNTTGAPVVATITVTPRFVNGGTTCTGTPRTFTITVNPLPVVSAGTLPARICISDTLVPLNGTPVGGSWSGIGTSGMNFVPTATAVGTWPITYTFSDLNGCTNRATIAATVLACEERDRDLDNRAVFLYPNPNNGQFNLRINSTRFNVLGMRVFNSAGQLVSTKQWSGLVFARVIPVNLTNLPAGVYMVRLYYGDGMDRGADRTFQIIVAR